MTGPKRGNATTDQWCIISSYAHPQNLGFAEPFLNWALIKPNIA